MMSRRRNLQLHKALRKQAADRHPHNQCGAAAWLSEDVPSVLSSVAELAAGHASGEAEVTDRYLIVHVRISEVVRTLGHGTNEDADALVGVELVDVAADTHGWGVKTESDLAALWGQVVGDGVVDDAEELLLRVG